MKSVASYLPLVGLSLARQRIESMRNSSIARRVGRHGGRAADPVFVRLPGLCTGGHPPRFRDFGWEDITCREAAGTAVTIRHAQRLTFEDVRINGALVPSPAL